MHDILSNLPYGLTFYGVFSSIMWQVEIWLRLNVQIVQVAVSSCMSVHNAVAAAHCLTLRHAHALSWASRVPLV